MALLILVCIDDFTYYTISNKHVLGIILLYIIAFSSGVLIEDKFWLTFNYACIFFTIFFIFNQLNYIGGGDVKLIFALILWIGADNVFNFALLVSCISVVITLIYGVAWKYILNLRRYISKIIWSRKTLQFFVQKKRVYTQKVDDFFKYEIPYGIPLALGTVCIVFSYRC